MEFASFVENHLLIIHVERQISLTKIEGPQDSVAHIDVRKAGPVGASKSFVTNDRVSMLKTIENQRFERFIICVVRATNLVFFSTPISGNKVSIRDSPPANNKRAEQ